MGWRDCCCAVHGRHALPVVPRVQLFERCDSRSIPCLEVSALHCVDLHSAAMLTLGSVLLFAHFSLALIPKCRKLLRSAFIGFLCTGLADVVSNTFKVRASSSCVLHSPIRHQVIKTLRQTRTIRLSYAELIRRESVKDGWFAFLTRGLKTKCFVLPTELHAARDALISFFFSIICASISRNLHCLGCSPTSFRALDLLSHGNIYKNCCCDILVVYPITR